jgi:hypothetical protein
LGTINKIWIDPNHPVTGEVHVGVWEPNEPWDAGALTVKSVDLQAASEGGFIDGIIVDEDLGDLNDPNAVIHCHALAGRIEGMFLYSDIIIDESYSDPNVSVIDVPYWLDPNGTISTRSIQCPTTVR